MIIAQNVDFEVRKKYDQMIKFMKIFSQEDEIILSMIPKGLFTKFLQSNREKIEEIINLDVQLNQNVDPEKISISLKTIYDNFISSDFTRSFVQINKKTVKKEEEFSKIMAPFKKDIQNFVSTVKVLLFLSILIV